MNDEKKIPGQSNQSEEEIAINKKGREADGKKINHQVEQKREQHQPRDNA